MKKTIFTVAIMALMLLTTSGYNDGDNGIHKGDAAPELMLQNDSKSFDLSAARGKYVLLSFWKSADAASRTECNKYSAWINSSKTDKINHISVNFDSEEALFNEITRRDGLAKENQFRVNGSQALQIKKDFRITEGYGSMLIDPDGKIISINPTHDELSSLL